MEKNLARSNYNRICGLISVLEDMHLRLQITADPNNLDDALYMGTLKDIAYHLETLRERTPWSPTSAKPGEGYL